MLPILCLCMASCTRSRTSQEPCIKLLIIYSPWRRSSSQGSSLLGWVRPHRAHFERKLFALPARLGGLGIINFPSCSSRECSASRLLAFPLTELILQQGQEYTYEVLDAQLSCKHEIHRERKARLTDEAEALKEEVSEALRHAMMLGQEKGASI